MPANPPNSQEQEAKRRLLKIETLQGMPATTALKHLGEMINLAADTDDSAMASHAIKLGEPLLAEKLPLGHKPLIHYFLSNAWAAIQDTKRQSSSDAWTWRNDELDRQILHLRHALTDPEFKKLHSSQQARILTNLANALSHIGRVVEAVELYDKALLASPGFGMALGNKGRALLAYADAHYDRGHQAVLISHAHALLDDCLKTQLEGRAEAGLRIHLERISKMVKNPKRLIESSQRTHPLGEHADEIAYRKWALHNRLFLNPLNDLGRLEIATHDPLSLPNLTTAADTGSKYHGLFNQLKQEFASARYLLHESCTAGTSHFSDHGTNLVDTLDYPAYGLAVEKAKLSLRMSYSLLDKIAFFINDYLELDIRQDNVSFNSIWFLNGSYKKGPHPIFKSRTNWPLRGLYWLSRDAYDPTMTTTLSIEPDAKGIRDLRHALEHRYVKVHMEGTPTPTTTGFMFDSLAHFISRQRLDAMALRSLKCSRAALIYLSLSVHSHERGKARARKSTPGKTMPINLFLFDDKFKT